MVERPADVGVTEAISLPIPRDLSVRSAVSLVILFLRSFVTTTPIGERFAYVFAVGGFASTLSRSNCG